MITRDLLDNEIKIAKENGDGINLTVSIIRTTLENEQIKYIINNDFVIDEVMLVENNTEYEMIFFSPKNK